MATQWYYAIDGQQAGPVSSKELKALADDGELKGGDLVWKEGMPDWLPASQVQGLIAQPAPPPAPETAPPAIDDEDAPAPVSSRRRRRRRSTRNIAGPLILVIAALPMIACIFVPWWSFEVKPGHDLDTDDVKGKWARSAAFVMKGSEGDIGKRLDALEKQRETLLKSGTSVDEKTQRQMRDGIAFLRIAKRSKKWWDKHLKSGSSDFDERLEELAEDVDKDEKLEMGMTIWGWNAGSGIMAVIFGAVILILGIVFLAVPVLRNWSWSVSIVATVMGIVALVFALLWTFQAPSKDVEGVFSQGIIVGPWMFLGAGALYFVVGLFDTIFGISFIARRFR